MSNAERQKRYREKKKRNGVTENVTKSVTVDDKNVTGGVTPIEDVKPSDDYPAIIHALADPVRRERLRRIANTLSERNLLGDVRYGNGVTFDVVGELLEAFPIDKKLYDAVYGVPCKVGLDK